MFSNSFVFMPFNCGLFLDNLIAVFPNFLIVLGLGYDKNFVWQYSDVYRLNGGIKITKSVFAFSMWAGSWVNCSKLSIPIL